MEHHVDDIEQTNVDGNKGNGQPFGCLEAVTGVWHGGCALRYAVGGSSKQVRSQMKVLSHHEFVTCVGLGCLH